MLARPRTEGTKVARPRVFVSSTYYDLKHVRSSLDLFIESLGFDSILSEKGDIAFTPDVPLDESCYREASSADIFVLIVGGRYGSEVSSDDKKPSRSFFDRYDSITKKEYESASSRDIPTYILIEDAVHSEYQTYLRNKDNTEIKYAHVDSVNVFKLIEEILTRPKNNPIHTFDRFSEIEDWLREQWAGLFRELLQRKTQQQELANLNSRVSELKEINETLRRYLEAVMTAATPETAPGLIETEQKRLQDVEVRERVRGTKWFNYVSHISDVSLEEFLAAAQAAKSFDDFANLIGKFSKRLEAGDQIAHTLAEHVDARSDINEIRGWLGLKSLRKSRARSAG